MRRKIAVAFAVPIAVVLALFIFIPERLPVPAGIGIRRCPLDIEARKGLVGMVAVITNRTSRTLRNVKIVFTAADPDEAVPKRQYFQEKWPPGKTIELGWLEGWIWESAEELTVSASGFRSKTVVLE